jgi:hypothetical protein
VSPIAETQVPGTSAEHANLGCYEGVGSSENSPGEQVLDFGQQYSRGAITCEK